MVNKPIPPCKGCKQRVAENPEKGTKDCHIKCEKYQHYREENDNIRWIITSDISAVAE